MSDETASTSPPGRWASLGVAAAQYLFWVLIMSTTMVAYLTGSANLSAFRYAGY